MYAWECRDKEDQGEIAFNDPLRRKNKSLTDENLRLKRLLRENGIAWSPVAQAHLNSTSHTKRKTRLASKKIDHSYLPMEVVLRILKFAMTSPFPIIDPLSKTTLANLTDKEKSQGNQVAIHFLATCKALNREGSRFLWQDNTFVFTTPEAVRNFAELSSEFRQSITNVTFRIIARYYDDKDRKHVLGREYHRDVKKDIRLPVFKRPSEIPLVRGGFRVYSWNQIIDFLRGLRAPFDPAVRLRSKPRAKLFPGLTSLRLDLVNFSESLLPFSGPEFHEVTSHEFGCTLNELQVTGLPEDDAGMKASIELSGLLKDEGLRLDGCPAFILRRGPRKFSLQPLAGFGWSSRVIRAHKEHLDDSDSDSDDFFNHAIGVLPCAPPERGHPLSMLEDSTVIWKLVPISRDGVKRSWVQFYRSSGREVKDYPSDDSSLMCPCCGEEHPESSFWDDFLEDMPRDD